MVYLLRDLTDARDVAGSWSAPSPSKSHCPTCHTRHARSRSDSGPRRGCTLGLRRRWSSDWPSVFRYLLFCGHTRMKSRGEKRKWRIAEQTRQTGMTCAESKVQFKCLIGMAHCPEGTPFGKLHYTWPPRSALRSRIFFEDPLDEDNLIYPLKIYTHPLLHYKWSKRFFSHWNFYDTFMQCLQSAGSTCLSGSSACLSHSYSVRLRGTAKHSPKTLLANVDIKTINFSHEICSKS